MEVKFYAFSDMTSDWNI